MARKMSPAGWFRRLWHGDEAALLAHYRRLSATDLRARFLHGVSDSFLVGHAQKLRGPDYVVIGWFADGAMRGVAEIARDGGMAEAGLSVEARWRSLGVGSALMRRALRRARLMGCGTLTIYTAPENAPMMRIAHGFGAALHACDGEVTCLLSPGPAGLPGLCFETIEDGIGLMAACSEAVWPVLAAGTRLIPANRAGGCGAAAPFTALRSRLDIPDGSR